MAATLVIGLGGTGCNIVERVVERMEREALSNSKAEDLNVEYVIMDTDVNKLASTAKKHPQIRVIQTSPRGTVGNALDSNEFARSEWFPLNESLMGKPFSEGAAQVRAISRLALDHTIKQGGMKELEEAIEQLRSLSGDTLHQEMRIMITGSLAGGTGSGILLPVALYIRNYLQTRYQDYGAIIRGLFLEPDAFFDVIQDETERNSLRCNAYATIRELDAFFIKAHEGDVEGLEMVRYNAPRPGSGVREYYPTLLPYNYVFLVDAINEEGEHLLTKLSYEQHAADILYAQALSETSASSNSKEDNAIKQQVASNGRSRYCGAGVSFLEYPVDLVRRYVALRWASQSVSNDWTSIDHAYELARKAGGESRDRGEFYAQTFKQLRETGGSPFINQAGKDTVQRKASGSAGRETTVEVTESFVKHVVQHAQDWNDHDLPEVSSEISQAIREDRFSGIPQDIASIDSTLNGEKLETKSAEYEQAFEMYLLDVKQYWNAVRTTASKSASAVFRQTYSFPRYEDPFTVHHSNWHFEALISTSEGKEAMHPAAMRYVLYVCIRALKERIQSIESSQLLCEDKINRVTNNEVDFDRHQPGIQSVGEAIRNILIEPGEDDSIPVIGAIQDLFTHFFTSKIEELAKKKRIVKLSKKLQDARQFIDEYRSGCVKIAALTACLNYLQTLADAYEQFFNTLDGRVLAMQHEIDEIEKDPQYNTRRGKTHRYVCADKRSLRGVFEASSRTNEDEGLPGDLCAFLHREIVDIVSTISNGQPNAKAENARRRKFEALFEDTVMQYWVSLVGNPRNKNARLLDKTVTEALVDEARYFYAERMLSDREMNAAIRAYVERTFESLSHLATPFIERPLASDVREISVCAYAPDAVTQVSLVRNQLTKALSEMGGEAHADYSKTQIMLYRSVYGFCADDLPKYAPAHDGHTKRTEGEYHRVYWTAVNQLSPVLTQNRLVTPHIDKNWHLITYLPDLNKEHEQQLIANTFKAFLFGLMWHEFGSEKSSSGNNFILKKKITRSGSKRPQMDLIVSNHTACDRFYEVYDALTFNPRVVNELLTRCSLAVDDELNQLAAPSVEKSQLFGYNGIRSHAFDRNSNLLENAKQHALARIASVKKAKADQAAKAAQGVDLMAQAGDSIDDFSEEFVTNLFRNDYEDARYMEGREGQMQMSIFTVPLLYRISLRYGARKKNEIEGMIEVIFDFTREYISRFCDPRDVQDKCDLLYAEQYMVFEENVAWLESYVDDIHDNPTARAIRDTVESYFESNRKYAGLVQHYMGEIRASWK